MIRFVWNIPFRMVWLKENYLNVFFEFSLYLSLSLEIWSAENELDRVKFSLEVWAENSKCCCRSARNSTNCLALPVLPRLCSFLPQSKWGYCDIAFGLQYAAQALCEQKIETDGWKIISESDFIHNIWIKKVIGWFFSYWKGQANIYKYALTLSVFKANA